MPCMIHFHAGHLFTATTSDPVSNMMSRIIGVYYRHGFPIQGDSMTEISSGDGSDGKNHWVHTAVIAVTRS